MALVRDHGLPLDALVGHLGGRRGRSCLVAGSREVGVATTGSQPFIAQGIGWRFLIGRRKKLRA